MANKEKEKGPKRTTSSLSTLWHDYGSSIRNLTSFWFFGLANNFGYVIMLSAAFDLLSKYDTLDEKNVKFKRLCNEMSTGAILLANILPSFGVKMISPFVPLWMHVRMAAVIVTYASGLILVALATAKAHIIGGVALVSFATGLGESSLIAYTVLFNTRNVISTWSSGTGAAGLLGSFSYSSLIQAGLSPTITILIMLIMPFLMGICFWVVLDRPEVEQFSRTTDKQDQMVPEEYLTKMTFMDKIRLIPYIVVKYTLFYGFVYFFEYFINQGLYELIQFPDTFLTVPEQYRWYNFCYQLGVFISRSSMNVVHIKWIWLLMILQGVNVVIFLTEVFFGYMHYLLIPLFIMVWEGLVGGAAYVNTFRLIATDMPEHQREYAMALNSIGDSIMISLAGAIAIPIHDAICQIPSPYDTLKHDSNFTYVMLK